RQLARLYSCEIVSQVVSKPAEMDYGDHNYHLFVLRCDNREALQRHLARQGVATFIHYPVPIHMQDAYADLAKGPGSYPVSERLADSVLSLPLFPELTDEEAVQVVESVNSFEGCS